MPNYLISFPSPAMVVPDDEWEAVGEAAREVVREAKAAGVFVFGGGLLEEVEPLMVAADGTFTTGTYPQTEELTGGFTVITVPTREEAVLWAAKIAVACRCSQELREFQEDPESLP